MEANDEDIFERRADMFNKDIHNRRASISNYHHVDKPASQDASSDIDHTQEESKR